MIDLNTPPLKPPRFARMAPESAVDDPCFVCVWVGNKYGFDYVARLYDMVTRAMGREIRFYCVTDNKLEDGRITAVHADERRSGWWQKPTLFREGKLPPGRMVYMDLDVTITGPIEWLWQLQFSEPICMIENYGPNKPHCAHNSSVMIWDTQDERVFRVDKELTFDVINKLHGDQCWVWRCFRDEIANIPSGKVVSFKYDVRGKPLSPSACVVVFHGNPKPDQQPGWWEPTHFYTHEGNNG